MPKVNFELPITDLDGNILPDLEKGKPFTLGYLAVKTLLATPPLGPDAEVESNQRIDLARRITSACRGEPELLIITPEEAVLLKKLCSGSSALVVYRVNEILNA